jgi:zinc transporter
MPEPPSSLIADSHGLICGFHLAPLARLEHDSLPGLDPSSSFWLHFNLTDGRARDWLREQAQLPRAAAEALLDEEPHVHVQTLPEGFVAVLRDLHHEHEGDEAGFGTFVVYVDAKRMISGRWHPLHTLDQLRRELSKGLERPSPLSLFEHLLECLAESFGAMVGNLFDRVDTAEDSILAGRHKDQGTELRKVRWLLSRLRREARANRSALARLPAHLPDACGAEGAQSLAVAIDRFGGVAQDLELVEERARLMQEEIAGRLGEATSRTLYTLSIVTTALLPITLITGIFGMNVGGLPWLEDPHGFAHVLLLMSVGVLVALALIRRSRAF